MNKGESLGLRGDDLAKYVEAEFMKDPQALRAGNDQEALDFVRDVLYKRQFSGDNFASRGAKSIEEFNNRHPAFSLVVGQLFFRTPIRVFEEGVRITPGLQLLAPKFLDDLKGKNGHQRQVRAQGESLASLAVAGAVLSLYAEGKLTGDGAYENWRQQRTRGDGPQADVYTLKMADGSTWSYRGMDPISTPVKLMVNGMELLNRLSIRQAQGEFIDKPMWDQGMAYISAGMMSITSAFRDANLLTGLDGAAKVYEAIGDPEGEQDAWLKFMGEKLHMMVPNTFTKLAKTNDPTLKDPADFWQVVEHRLGHLGVDRKDIKTSYSYDVLGNTRRIADTGALWNIFSTATHEERARGMSPEAQFVMTELDRLQREAGAVYSPKVKHSLTGDFDLRTVLTSDGTETLYDRWQKNYRELEPEKVLYPILSEPLPDGTFQHKGLRRDLVEGVINQLKDAAFMKTMAEEQRVIDEVIDLQLNKAKSKAGLFDIKR
jgi:hypothetical protein